MWDRVLPGDEKQIKYSGLARMATPIHPVMDEANLDVWAFYVPDRLWWNHAREFYGENKDASFNPDGEYVMPFLKPKQYGVDGSSSTSNNIGSLNDYFGFPCIHNGIVNNDEPRYYCTAGLHRSYQLIWNEWFRNSSIQPALQLNDGDTVSDAEWTVISQIRKANKYPDYYTTLLREPQAGEDVLLPLGEWAPVVTRSNSISVNGAVPLEIGNTSGQATGSGIYPIGVDFNMGESVGDAVQVTDSIWTTDPQHSSNTIAPSNLWADLTSGTAATINNLRSAITIQHLLEVDAIAGKRYQQIIQAHFGVLTPDSTLQRPELLGATRTPIGMRQVIQTSETSDGSPLGNTAAFSLTNVSNEWICNKAFTEPGFILILGCVRPVISYSQGINPLLTKLNRYDHYWPVFDNLGNQPVYGYNIYADFNPNSDDLNVFGYQEAWTEYRVMQNRVSGLMRPDVNETLSSWNYAVDFDAVPTLDSDFIAVDKSLMERSIAVQSQPQFILDSYFDYRDTKNMSVHSIPGLQRL